MSAPGRFPSHQGYPIQAGGAGSKRIVGLHTTAPEPEEGQMVTVIKHLAMPSHLGVPLLHVVQSIAHARERIPEFIIENILSVWTQTIEFRTYLQLERAVAFSSATKC